MNSQIDLFERNLENQLLSILGPGYDLALTDNIRTMVSVDKSRFPIRARVSRIFTMAGQDTILQLARYISANRGPLPIAVKKFIHEAGPMRKAGRKKSPKLRTKGSAHDLKAIANYVSQEYFNKELVARITWGNKAQSRPKRARRRSIRYGSYDRDLDLITIHPALDSDRTPSMFIEFVIYHEMLHKVIPPVAGHDGKIWFHTREFRARERMFKGYEQTMEWEKANIWKALK